MFPDKKDLKHMYENSVLKAAIFWTLSRLFQTKIDQIKVAIVDPKTYQLSAELRQLQLVLQISASFANFQKAHGLRSQIREQMC